MSNPNDFVIVNGVLRAYKGKEENVSIPAGVTRIGREAFFGCNSLQSVTIPDGVTGVGDRAFSACGKLRSVALPNSLTEIGENAFGSVHFILPPERDVCWLIELDPKVELPGVEMMLWETVLDAEEAQMTAIISWAAKWSRDWKKRFFAIYMHSGTRAAMLLADRRGEFGQYAAMRHKDEDELRDGALSDLGLDDRRRKVYDLGGVSVTARLTPELRFVLELPDGTALKSLPKKGADPEKHRQAKDDFALIKKEAVQIWKNRAAALLGDFLSGRERTAAYWANTYGGNPILHAVACLLVWEQGGTCFTRTDAGTVLADGMPYALTDAPVKVAHPMEMKQADVEAWQRYFVENGLKQPFEQVWEPVADASLVKPGRYDGCTVPLYMLMNKEKHGIIMEGRSKITLRDCSADLIYIEGHHDWYNNEFEVKNFKFKKYTRQVNHIVCHLDKATVAGRVKKDDVSAARWFGRFTPAQIRSFIDLAQENHATNVLALLLEYQNTHFPEFDPMAEFTLEW